MFLRNSGFVQPDIREGQARSGLPFNLTLGLKMNKAIASIVFSVLLVFAGYCIESKSPFGHSSLGISFDDFLKRVPAYDQLEEDRGTVRLYVRGEWLLSFSDKGLNDRIVRMLDVFSPSVPVKGGIVVGMSVSDVVKLFPGIPLSIDTGEGDGEYFVPPSLQKMSPEGSPDIVTLLFVSSNDGRPLGTGREDDYPTTKFRTGGIVRYISMYRWK